MCGLIINGSSGSSSASDSGSSQKSSLTVVTRASNTAIYPPGSNTGVATSDVTANEIVTTPFPLEKGDSNSLVNKICDTLYAKNQ